MPGVQVTAIIRTSVSQRKVGFSDLGISPWYQIERQPGYKHAHKTELAIMKWYTVADAVALHSCHMVSVCVNGSKDYLMNLIILSKRRYAVFRLPRRFLTRWRVGMSCTSCGVERNRILLTNRLPLAVLGQPQHPRGNQVTNAVRCWTNHC